MTSSWIRVESTSMTTRRRPRRASPPAATAMSSAVDAGLEGQLAAQPVDVRAGHVELDGGHRVARQPPDAVDVGAVDGDPRGDRGDARWRAAGRPARTTAARPLRRGALSPVPTLILTLMPRSRRREVRPSRSRSSARPAASSMARVRWPRTTTCSRSRTSAPTSAMALNKALVTPGPVLTGDGHQQGLRGRASGTRARLSDGGHRAGHRCGRLAMRPGRGAARGRSSGRRARR